MTTPTPTDTNALREAIGRAKERDESGNFTVAANQTRNALAVDLFFAAPGMLDEIEALRRIAADNETEAALERVHATNVEAERDSLKAEVERLRARHDWMIDQAAWLRHEHTAYVAVPVPLSSDLSSKATRAEAVDRAFSAALRGEEASRG